MGSAQEWIYPIAPEGGEAEAEEHLGERVGEDETRGERNGETETEGA